MAEFLEVMKEWKRMCGMRACNGCPLDRKKNSFDLDCDRLLDLFPKEFEAIVMKWSAEHPRKTLRDRFFETFPDAPKNIHGNPKFCPQSLGWEADCNDDCEECWLTPWGEDNG